MVLGVSCQIHKVWEFRALGFYGSRPYRASRVLSTGKSRRKNCRQQSPEAKAKEEKTEHEKPELKQ